jgi:two-component system chemotaxis response regulator CheY
LRFELLRILVVDDNHHMRVLLTEILRAIGVRHVYEVADGTEALLAMRRQPMDMVITDLAMAPMDGIDFVRLLRNAADSPNTLCPVLMVSGHSSSRRVAEARDAGVNEFLAKPVTARGVLERVVEMIDHPRPYVRSSDYFGPERRRRNEPNYVGPRRRVADSREQQIEG